MTYAAQWSVSQDTAFQQRLALALAKAAQNIQAEAPTTANHWARSKLCVLVLADPAGYAQRYAPSVCADGTITLTSIDTDLDTHISSLWNSWCVAG